MSGEWRNALRLDPAAAPQEGRFDSWTRGYAPLDGIPDEFIGADGAPRPHWTRFFSAMARLEPSEIDRRFGAADRHIRDMGISYRV